MPTEKNVGGTLLYIANHLSYKPRTDLNLNITNQLQSTFIEIINSRKSNIIVGCIILTPFLINYPKKTKITMIINLQMNL